MNLSVNKILSVLSFFFLSQAVLPQNAAIPENIRKMVRNAYSEEGIDLRICYGMDISTPNGQALAAYEIRSKDKLLGLILCRRVMACTAQTCPITGDLKPETAEFFDYALMTDQKGIVKDLQIYNYQASYGEEVTQTEWLNQFIGYCGTKSLEYGEDIQAITGATVSVYALMYDIMYTIRALPLYLKG